MLFRSAAALAGLTFALFALPLFGQPGRGERPPAGPKPTRLPLTRVVLYTAGVGYFQREGTIDGPARVDLNVAEEDVNDLIKTLIAADADGKPAGSVTVDGSAPAGLTLKTFVIDVTANPTIPNILNQVRGEQIQVTTVLGDVSTGSLVTVLKPNTDLRTVTEIVVNGKTTTTTAPSADKGSINLLTEDGVESVSLGDVKKFKFLNAELQAEFREALALMAAARSAGTKAVGVSFPGEGKRDVRVGYVAEAPLWKPNYRLTLDDSPTVQTWATIENTTDEDWTNVKLALVSGRPMTFKMDLYDPLFVPRPTVEPELYASLRPPVYQARLTGEEANRVQGGGGIGNLVGQLGQGGGFQGGFQGGFGGGNLGVGGGIAGGGFGGGGFGGYFGTPPLGRPTLRNLLSARLDYDSFRDRAGVQPKPEPAVPTGDAPSASADFGRSFRYDIPDPVSLPRFKTALVPVATEGVDVERVSVYNPAVLGNHPLLGLKVTNKTKQFFAQGPVAVYDGADYAGDARLPDVEPGETRLLSYAIDLDVTVTTTNGETKVTPLGVTVEDGVIWEKTRSKRTTKYRLVNRAGGPRVVSVTRPAAPTWDLIAPEKPTERTKDLYRFEVTLQPGAVDVLEVVEESTGRESRSLGSTDEFTLKRLRDLPDTAEAVRAAINRVLDARAKHEEMAATIRDEQARLQEIVDNQARIRQNLERVPKYAEAFARYVKKFDEQETEIEQRQAKVRELQKAMATAKKELDDYVRSVTLP